MTEREKLQEDGIFYHISVRRGKPRPTDALDSRLRGNDSIGPVFWLIKGGGGKIIWKRIADGSIFDL